MFHVKCMNGSVYIGNYSVDSNSYSEENFRKKLEDSNVKAKEMADSFFSAYSNRRSQLSDFSYIIRLLSKNDKDLVFSSKTQEDIFPIVSKGEEYFALIDFEFDDKVLRLFVVDQAENKSAHAAVSLRNDRLPNTESGKAYYEVVMKYYGTLGFDNFVGLDSKKAREYPLRKNTEFYSSIKHEMMHVLQNINSHLSKDYGTAGLEGDSGYSASQLRRFRMYSITHKIDLKVVMYYLNPKEFYAVLQTVVDLFRKEYLDTFTTTKSDMDNELVRDFLSRHRGVNIMKDLDKERYRKFVSEFYKAITN